MSPKLLLASALGVTVTGREVRMVTLALALFGGGFTAALTVFNLDSARMMRLGRVESRVVVDSVAIEKQFELFGILDRRTCQIGRALPRGDMQRAEWRSCQ